MFISHYVAVIQSTEGASPGGEQTQPRGPFSPAPARQPERPARCRVGWGRACRWTGPARVAILSQSQAQTCKNTAAPTAGERRHGGAAWASVL